MILKPKDVRRKREAVKVFPDGREVCQNNVAGKLEYRSRTLDAAARQDWICRICHLAMNILNVTLDHEDGRGMNGSHRDDRIVKNGKPYNAAVHSWCNGEKASRRGYGTATTSAT